MDCFCLLLASCSCRCIVSRLVAPVAVARRAAAEAVGRVGVVARAGDARVVAREVEVRQETAVGSVEDKHTKRTMSS